jgi:DNA polymerase-3 subunit alpha
MAGLDTGLERAQRAKSLQAIKQMSMFEALAEAVTDDWLPDTPDWQESEKLAREKEALGVYLSGHPLDSYRHILKSWVKVTTADLPDVRDGESVALGVVVTAVKEKTSKKGGRLAILTVEDLTGSVKVLVFGEVLEKMAPWLSQPSLPLWLKGEVLHEERGTKIVGREVAPLGTSLPRWPARLDLRLRAATLTLDQLRSLREILGRHQGSVPAYLHFLDPQENGVLALPESLALTPSEDLAAEVNHLFGYPVLNL